MISENTEHSSEQQTQQYTCMHPCQPAEMFERRFKLPHCNRRCCRTSRQWRLHLFWQFDMYLSSEPAWLSLHIPSGLQESQPKASTAAVCMIFAWAICNLIPSVCVWRGWPYHFSLRHSHPTQKTQYNPKQELGWLQYMLLFVECWNWDFKPLR